jgi:fibronectin-binding autotransporter adhesin
MYVSVKSSTARVPRFTYTARRRKLARAALAVAAALAPVRGGSVGQAWAASWDTVPGVSGSGDGVVNGGTGAWDLITPNWTNDGGLTNVTWVNGDPAIFGGAAGGVVTIAGGGVTAGSLAFDLTTSGTGYMLASQTAADVLTLAGPQVAVSQDATVNAILGGSAGLTKLGGGTLTLGGANTFSGTVTVAGGRLSVGSAANLGAASGLVLDGGAFESTGALTFGGPVSIGAGGGTIRLGSPAAAVSLSGLLSSSGPLVVDTTGGGSLAVTHPSNFNGVANGYTGNLSLVGGGSATLAYAIAAPAGQVFSATGGTLNLGNSVPGATVSLSGGSTVQASNGGVVRLAGRASAPGVGVSVGGDLNALAGGRIEVGDGLDDAGQIRLLNTSRLTADGGTIVLRPRAAALAVDASTVGSLAIRNGGVLALGAGATGDLVLGADVNQLGGWVLANQSGQTLRVMGGVQDTTAGLTLRAEGGVIRYETDTINLGSTAANGTVGVELRGGTVDINNNAAGKTFTYSSGYVVSGWGQLGTSAANQTHFIGTGAGPTFYANGPAALAPTLSIVGGFNELTGARASFRIADNNGLMLTVPNATAAPYSVGSVAIDPQSAGSVARFAVGGGAVQAIGSAFANPGNKVRFDVLNGGTLISDVAGTGTLLVTGTGAAPINVSGGATFSTTSPTFLLKAGETIGGTGTLFGVSGLSGTSPTNLTLNGTVDLNGTLAAVINSASTGNVRVDAGETLTLTAAADLQSTSLTYGGATAAPATLEVSAPSTSLVRIGTAGAITNAAGFAGTREFRVNSGTFQVDVADTATVTIDGVNQLSVDRTANTVADRALLGTLNLTGGAFQAGATASTTTVSAGATLSGRGTYGRAALSDTLVNHGTVQAQGGQLNVNAAALRGGGTWDPNGQLIALSGAIQDVAAGSPTQLRVAGANGGRVQIGQGSTYTGGTVVDGSAGASPVTLRVQGSGALGTGGVTLNSGVLQLLSENSLNYGTTPVTVVGSGPSQIVHDRLATQTAGRTHTIGALTLGGQTLTLTGPPTSAYQYSLSVGATTVNPVGGAIIQQGSSPVSFASLALNGNLSLTLSSTGFTVGALSGPGTLTRTAASGTLTLNRAASNFTGNLTTAVGTTNLSASNVLAGGTYLFTNNGAATGSINVSATGALNGTTGTHNAGQLNLNAVGSLDGTTVALTGGNIFANADRALGTGTVLARGGNLFLRRDANTAFGGTVTVSGGGIGSLTVDRANNGAGSGGLHTISALNLVDRQLNLFQANGYTLGVTGATTISGTGTATIDNEISQLSLASLQLDAGLLLTGTGSTTIGQLGGSGVFRQASGGTVTVTGAALPGFTGNVQVAGGTLVLSHPDALAGGSLTVAGGVLNLSAPATTPLALTSGFLNANVENALNGQPLSITNGTLFATVNNALGASTINMTGGNITATAAGALGTAQVNVTNAALALRSDTSAAMGGNVAIGGTNFSTISVARRTDAGGTGNRLSINGLSLGGQTLNITGADNYVFAVINPVTLTGTAATTINTTAADAVFQGALSGTAPLTKSGVRTLTLDGGANLGAVAVNAGTLVVNNAFGATGVTVGGTSGAATLELGGNGANTLGSLAVNAGTLRITRPATAADALPAGLAVNAGMNGDVTVEYAGAGNGRLGSAVNVDTSLGARKLTLSARSGTAPGQGSTFTYSGLIGRSGANGLTVAARSDSTQVDDAGNLLRSPSRMVLAGNQTFTGDLQHGGGTVIGKGIVPASGAGPFGAGANPLQMTVMDSAVGGMVADGQSSTTFSKAVTTAAGGAPRMRLGSYYNAATGGVQTVNFNGSFAWNDASFPLVVVPAPGTPGGAASASLWNGLFAEPGTILQFNSGAVLDNVLTASGTNVTSAAPVYAGGGGIVRFNSNFNESTYRNLAAGVGLAGQATVLDGTILQSYTSGRHFDGVALRTGNYQVGVVNQSLAGGFAVSGSPFDVSRKSSTVITDFSLTLNGGPGRAFAIGAGQTLIKSGGATLTVNGDQLHGAGATLAVNAGTVHVNTDAGMNDAGATPSNKLGLSVAGGFVNLNVSQHLAHVVVSGGVVRLTAASPTGSRVLDTTGVSVTGGQLDLTNNRLIVDYDSAVGSPINSVRLQVAAGFNAGGTPWAGSGIVSSQAALDATLALGYGEASELLGAAGGVFGSEPVDATSVLVRLTKNADANLDGSVNFADLLALAKNYGQTGMTWNRGDFNYDATVNFADLLALAKNYNAVLPSEPIPGATAEFSEDLAAAFAVAVPEPTSVGALGLLAAGGLMRRRRKA